MNKLATVAIMFLLMASVMPVQVFSASVPIEVTDIIITTSRGRFVGEITDFKITFNNPNTETRTDNVRITFSPEVENSKLFSVTLGPEETKTLSGYSFRSYQTGRISITVSVVGGSSRTYNDIWYYDFASSINIDKAEYYPSQDGTNKMQVLAVVTNNGTQSVKFMVSLSLTDSRGSSAHNLIPKSISMTSGTPPSPIPTTQQFTITIPSKATASITCEYAINDTDVTGPWTADIKVQPTLFTTPIVEQSDQTNLFAPDVTMDVNAKGIYEIGKKMTFIVTLTNGSKVVAEVESLLIEMRDSRNFERLQGHAGVWIDGEFGRVKNAISLNPGQVKPVTVEIEINKGDKDEYEDAPYWDPAKQYTLLVTADVKGREDDLVKQLPVSLSPYSPNVTVDIIPPVSWELNKPNTVTLKIINGTSKPITNMVARLLLHNYEKAKRDVVPQEIIGINLESASFGGTPDGNVFEQEITVTPREEGQHKLYYSFNENEQFTGDLEQVSFLEFTVTSKPLQHNLAFEPTPVPTQEQVVYGSPVTVPIKLVNKGTYSEYYQLYADILTGGDAPQFIRRIEIGTGTLEPGEDSGTRHTLTIPTAGTSGIGRGYKVAQITVSYKGSTTAPTVPFEVVSQMGTRFNATADVASGVNIGQQSVLRINVTNLHDEKMHYNITIDPPPGLGFIDFSESLEINPSGSQGSTQTVEFPFVPIQGSLGSNQVIWRVNGQQQANVKVYVETLEETEVREKEQGFLSNNMILIIGAVIVLAIVGLYIYSRSKKKEAPRMKSSKGYDRSSPIR